MTAPSGQILNRPKIDVQSAADLFAALDSPHAGIQASMLQAIAANPERAYAYGAVGGQDLIDRLILLARTAPPSFVRTHAVSALACYRDTRVLAFLEEALTSEPDASAVLALEPRLRLEPLKDVRGMLGRMLMREAATPAPSLMAARLLSDCADLTAAECLRVAILSDRAVPSPTPAEATDAWVDELGGPFAERTRALLIGQPGFAGPFRSHWPRLDGVTRRWLLEHSGELVETALSGGSDDDVLAALRSAVRFSVTPSNLCTLQDHTDPRIRAAAIQLGAGDVPFLHALIADSSADTGVRLAAIDRCRGGGEPTFWTALLHDGNWRIRAAAVQALVALGGQCVDALRPLALDAAQSVRVAAVQALWQLGQEEWLVDNLADVD